jgi:hypothetical protein
MCISIDETVHIAGPAVDTHMVEGTILKHNHDDMLDIPKRDSIGGAGKCQQRHNVFGHRHCCTPEELNRSFQGLYGLGGKVLISRTILFPGIVFYLCPNEGDARPHTWWPFGPAIEIKEEKKRYLRWLLHRWERNSRDLLEGPV